MAGIFTIGEKKTRPGVYHRIENGGGVSTAGAVNGIGSGVLRANWGPLNEVVEFEPGTNVKSVYGSGQTQDLITEMFTGGATSGFFVRAGEGGTEPKITLQGSEAAAGTITGAYVGDREFTVTIRDSITSDQRECIIYDGTAEFVKVTFEPGENEPAALAHALKESTKDFIFTPDADAKGPLAAVQQAEFAAGTNPSVTTEAYSKALVLAGVVPANAVLEPGLLKGENHVQVVRAVAAVPNEANHAPQLLARLDGGLYVAVPSLGQIDFHCISSLLAFALLRFVLSVLILTYANIIVKSYCKIFFNYR